MQIDRSDAMTMSRPPDVGLRTRLGPITMIAGAFDIQRPYYGVDGNSIFRRLGAVRHRGLEVSLTGEPLP